MKKEKVIIDTDIGNDIDDTLAIILATRSEELKVLGITTVYNDTIAKAKVAKHILKILKKEEIPVIPGLKKPLNVDSSNPFFKVGDSNKLPRQYKEEMKDERIELDHNVIDYLYHTIKNQEEPITILAIGPLTNIATLIKKHEDIKTKIKKIVIMGGAYYMNQAEYNFICDPDAAKIVLESGIDILAVGLDVTNKCQLRTEHLEYIKSFNTPLSEYLIQLINEFMGYRNHIPYLHDPLAIMAAIKPSLLNIVKAQVAVETKGDYTKGFVLNMSNHKWWANRDDVASIYVSKEVNKEEAIEEIIKRIFKKVK